MKNKKKKTTLEPKEILKPPPSYAEALAQIKRNNPDAFPKTNTSPKPEK